MDRQGCGEVAVARPYEAQNHRQSAIVGAAIGRPQSFTPCLPQSLLHPYSRVWQIFCGFMRWQGNHPALRAPLHRLHRRGISQQLLYIGMGFKNSPPAEGWREATGWSPSPIHIYLLHPILEQPIAKILDIGYNNESVCYKHNIYMHDQLFYWNL